MTTTKWQASMTLDRFTLYQAGKAAFEAYQPTGYSASLGELLADEVLLAAKFPLPEAGSERIRATHQMLSGKERISDITLTSTRERAIKQLRANVTETVANLAKAVINAEIGAVGGRRSDADPSARDAQVKLDTIFGFDRTGVGSRDGVSAETLKITDTMRAAIKASIAEQRAREAGAAIG